MQSAETVKSIVNIMKKAQKENYSLLHCVSSYPTQPIDCNLQHIVELKQQFPNTVIGYSGHEEGILISQAAVLLGARIIERHFTLDKQQKGSDHQCSLNPHEMMQLINDLGTLKERGFLKNCECSNILNMLPKDDSLQLALKKNEFKNILPCEIKCKQKLGKSIVASRIIKSGKILEEADIDIKVSEPNGIPAEDMFAVLGMKLNCTILEDEPILYENLK